MNLLSVGELIKKYSITDGEWNAVRAAVEAKISVNKRLYPVDDVLAVLEQERSKYKLPEGCYFTGDIARITGATISRVEWFLRKNNLQPAGKGLCRNNTTGNYYRLSDFAGMDLVKKSKGGKKRKATLAKLTQPLFMSADRMQDWQRRLELARKRRPARVVVSVQNPYYSLGSEA